MDTPQAEAVYELVTRVFADLGAASPQQLNRSLLLRHGFYAGQVYRCEGWQAVWLIDKGCVEFSDCQGQPCRTVALLDEQVRMAA